MIVARRTFIKGAGATLALAPAAARYAAGATSTINAIRLLQGGPKNLWSSIYGDSRALGFPISAKQIFLNIAPVFRNSFPKGYPGIYTIAGIYDANGHPIFQVNLLPPNTAIPGSISNPSLQVILTAGSQAGAPKLSYVIPEFTKIDGAYHTMQFVVGMLPTDPARFVITAADVNNATMNFSFNTGYWTNAAGTVPLSELLQTPPTAFSIPTMSSGLPNDTNMVFAIGGPMKDRLNGYSPYGGVNQDLFTSPMDFTQFYLGLNPPAGGPPSITFPSVLTMRGWAAAILSSINTTNIHASAAEESAGLLMNNPPPATSVQSVRNNTATLSSSITATVTTATKNGASSNVMQSLGAARNYAGQAGQILSSMSISAPNPIDTQSVYYLLNAAYNETIAAGQYATADTAGATQASYSTPIASNTNNTVTTINGAGAPNVVSEGNATSTTTSVVSGNVTQVDNGSGNSGLQNQVNNVTMYNGGAPIQPAASDPHVTIENMTITPDIP